MTAENADFPALPIAAAPAREGARAPLPRGRLFRKYVLFFVGLVAVALLVNSGFDFWFGYQENKDALIRLQQGKADAAAQRIEEFVDGIQRQIGWTTHAQWSAAPLDQRRFDFVRLLRQVPAITEISEIDREGKEQLKVSRLAMDVIGSGRDLSQTPGFTEARAHKVWFSPVYFRKESEPYMSLAMARAGRDAGVTVAEVNLKLIWDVITALKIGQGGYAYVVDARGKLIAHPDISLVLRDTDFRHLPHVADALSHGSGNKAVSVTRNNSDRDVLSAHATIAPLDWLVFVEVPFREAFAPLYGAALRSAALLTLGLLAAGLAALFLARRMTGPIRALQAGAAQIGAGDLNRRIDIHTGDELEALARQFNSMATDLQTSYAELEHKVEERTAALSEALDQQTATADVLGVINSSPGDLKPVFEAMLEKALTLCGAAFGALWTYDGERVHAAAQRGLSPRAAEFLSRGPHAIGPANAHGRLLRGEPIVHIADVTEDEAYRVGDPVRLGLVESGGRTLLAVPLRRKDAAFLGDIVIFRTEVRTFTEKQIALLQNFAAQAVIAMENARLITETREALEQQTATAEVLGVINSSPGDLAPVFDAMLDKALTLCGASVGQLAVRENARFRTVITRGMPAEFVEYRRHNPPDYGPGTQPARLLAGEAFIHVADLKAEKPYLDGEPNRRALVDLGSARTSLMVPLRRDNAMLGFINIYRSDVRPFSEKQIALLQNFAAQAVIAMENARLLGEIRQRQQELRVTLDNMADGVAMFDADLRLAAWNRNFQELLDLPDAFLAEPHRFDDYIGFLVGRGEFGETTAEAELRRLRARFHEHYSFERVRPDGRIVEVRHNPMPEGGFVLIYSDITERKRSEAEIRAARDAAETALRELKDCTGELDPGREDGFARAADGRYRSRDQEPAQLRQQFCQPVGRVAGGAEGGGGPGDRPSRPGEARRIGRDNADADRQPRKNHRTRETRRQHRQEHAGTLARGERRTPGGRSQCIDR